MRCMSPVRPAWKYSSVGASPRDAGGQLAAETAARTLSRQETAPDREEAKQAKEITLICCSGPSVKSALFELPTARVMAAHAD